MSQERGMLEGTGRRAVMCWLWNWKLKEFGITKETSECCLLVKYVLIC